MVRALEASGLCAKGKGGEYLEEHYTRMMDAIRKDDEKATTQDDETSSPSHVSQLLTDPSFFPVNTHGGLLCYGAPWEVPAMFNIVEATQQLRGTAPGRQIDSCRRALVYGNGGILSASAVAILSQSL